MNKTIGWLIAGVGGYWLLEQLGYVPCLFGCTQATTTPTATSPQAANPNNAVNATAAATTAQLVADAMTKNNDNPNAYHTVWQWNFYYQNVRGVPGPDPNVLFPTDPNATTKMYSWSEYWTAMQGQGFSGLGMIAKNINPYNNPMGSPFGSYLTPRGIETYVVNPS